MTKKPSRKNVAGQYSHVPYFAVKAAVWCVTILSYFPTWFYRPLIRASLYVVRLAMGVIR